MVRILILDDDAENRKATEEMFSQYGDCESLAVEHHAVEVFKVALSGKKPIDLIALDLSQEYHKGIGFIKTIRGLEKEQRISKTEYVKIMVTTDLREAQVVKACAEAGCNSYVLKPLKEKVIFEKLSDMGLKQAPGRQETP